MNGNWANVFPYLAGALKLIVLAIGAYFAIKWHFDEDRRVREEAGVVFDKPTIMKKLAMVLAIPVLLIVLIFLSIYSTNWILDHY
ncbi:MULTISPECIES: hypothetical protein [Vibrio]|uniref:hypothetical protein n=1 Tax=Vibrio TaxID=662 RepID=UPI000B5C701F|nr:hypothetical protein [Vibrio rumoiensis]